MNLAAIQRYFEDWSGLGAPYRPTPDGLRRYRESVEGLNGPSILILGGTPELADLAVQIGAKEIVRIDGSPEILKAMESFATEDWSSIESLSGNWLDLHPEFNGRFDVVWSDGGPLFIRMPDDMATLFANVGNWLKRGGIFETKIQSPPIPPAEVARCIEDLIEEIGRHDGDILIQLGELWQLDHFNAIGADGKTDREKVRTALNQRSAQLLERFPEHAEVINKTYSRFLEEDGMTCLVSFPNKAQMNSLIEASMFEFIQETLLPDSRPVANYCWHLSLRKP